MGHFLIYGLVDPRSGDVRYIGRSSSGLQRPRNHFRNEGLLERNYKANWVRGLVRNGLAPTIRVLEEFDRQSDLPWAEQFWIAQGRSLGWPLTNLTDGGEGSIGLVLSPEAKAKISAWRRGRPLSAAHRAAIGRAGMGRRMSAESREKCRVAKLGRPRPPHVIEALRRANIGTHRSMEWRVNQSRRNGVRPFIDSDGERHELLATAADKFHLTRQGIAYRLRRGTAGFRFVEDTPCP